MSTSKRNHSVDFKTKVGLEAIKEKHTIEELAHKYELHPSVVKNWKKIVLENLSNCFSNDTKSKKMTEQESKELYAQIGKLKVENDFLKKKLW
jgi:transposase-like protein